MEEINPPLGDGQPPVPPKDAPVCMDTGDPGVKGEEETRLMISKIVCENFKSYAGIKEIGPFHKCFSSIVGPNGSGKSNVIDSMLFVFGYRAKRIRSKKISILIHNSGHHLNIQSCTVSVHFQRIIDLPGDDYQLVDGSQFVVSRTAHKDNSSYYQLNGRRVPFKEVAALLRGSGIDLDHNRFLILQGEVEQIALMKPKAQTEHDDGMLEFLEDIIGTSCFKEPIEQLSKKVEELSEARGEKLNRVKAAEKERTDLEGAKNEAEHYLTLQREKTSKQLTLYSKYITEITEKDSEVRKMKEQIEVKVEALQNTLNGQAAIKKEKVSLQKKAMKAYERLGEEDEKCKGKLASCETRDVRARQDLKNATNSSKKISKSLEKEKQRLVELESAPQTLTKEIKDQERKLKILETRKNEEDEKLTQVMEGLKTATKDLQEEKSCLELKLVDLNQILNEAKSNFEVAQAELDLYQEKATVGKRQLEDAQEKLASIRADMKSKKSELKNLKDTLPLKKQELETAESELTVTIGAFDKLSQQVQNRRGHMEEARSSLESHKSRGQLSESLLEQSRLGNISGIYGRLGDLGAIDEKYDVAISTACGGLDNIIVDTMETAIKCVEFLRKNNLGVATFIGLDKIEHLRAKATSKIATPDNVPRLFDLVRAKDARYLTAFYNALHDTLVARDLDQATRIGLQGRTRHRVVTLSGQLIDTAGTMSGGGNRPLKGRMSSKLRSDVTPQQLTKLEGDLNRDEKALRDCARRKNELEDKTKQLKIEIKEMENTLKQLSRDLQVMGVQDSSLSQRMHELEQQASEDVMDPVHLGKLKKQVSLFEKDHRKARSDAGKIQEQVDKLHHSIMEVGGSRMQTQQAQVAAINKDIEGCNSAIAKANVGIKTAARNTGKCQKKVSSLEEELTELEERKKELRSVLEALVEEAREILSKQEEIREAVSQEEVQLLELKKEIESFDSQETEVQGSLVDLRHEVDKYNSRLKDSQQKIKHYQNELKKLNPGEEMDFDSKEGLLVVDNQLLESEITALRERLEQMTPNMASIEEYKRKEELHLVRLKELDAVTEGRDEARKEFEGMRKERLDKFMAGFSMITNKLKEMYQMITLGGDAELELVDSLDPFSEGIVFSVRPPKKSWKNISNLSGGEKTLSSLALVFALHHYKPSPLYVMDEIDAALDFKNVSIVAHYIKERTKNAQFIIISLRNNMFELADRLIGIYKTQDTTKSVTVDPYKIARGLSSETITPSLA